MKKISVLIMLILCVTIGGVYATWTYTQATDVADEAVNMNMNLTDVYEELAADKSLALNTNNSTIIINRTVSVIYLRK